jgi:type VI secretion system FHA domain protein
MTLTLDVTGPQGAVLGAGRRMVFGSGGGTIGRNPGDATHWTLPDQHVSSTHAVIRCQNGVFTIEDRSRNGTFLNSLENRLPAGERHPLKHGDTIFIDPFDIRVSMTEAAVSEPRGEDPFAMPAASASRPPQRPADAWPPPGSAPILPPLDPVSPDSGVSPSGDSVIRGLGLPGPAPPRPKPPSSSDLESQRGWRDSFSPPAPVPPRPEGPPDIPTNWQDDAPSLRSAPPAPRRPDPSGEFESDSHSNRPLPGGHEVRRARDQARLPDRPSSAARRPAPPRHPPSEESGAYARGAFIDLEELFRGAGLDPADAPPELAPVLGQILRIVVQGTMDVLHARRGIKDEFRIEHTIFEPVGKNNPLKFSAGVEDALHNLLVRRSPGYLGPAAAFEDAFDDLRHHQMAMLDGMRVAFEAMLERFDPAKLEEEFDRQQKKGARLAVPMKPRYWEAYSERFRDMVKDPEAAFRELFGDEFRAAYREQLARLKAQSRSGKA